MANTFGKQMQVYDVGKGIWTAKGDELEKAKEDFIATFKQLEETLGDNPFFGGQTFGFVDVALIPYYSWFYVYESFGNFKIEAECPKLIAWVKRCAQRESVSKSLADEEQVYKFVLGLRKKLGLD